MLCFAFIDTTTFHLSTITNQNSSLEKQIHSCKLVAFRPLLFIFIFSSSDSLSTFPSPGSKAKKTHFSKHPFEPFFTTPINRYLQVSENTSPYDLKTMTHFEFVKKLKRLNPLDHSLGILGFFLVTLGFICCFFYLDYRVVTRGFHSHGHQQGSISWLELDGSSGGDGRLGFLEEGGDVCDVFDGDWVWDETYPLYQSKDCIFIDEGFRCSENGRPDNFFTKWRWQPKGCNLPRFDAKKMLEKLQNRRVVFVGDSVGRNQWESLLCMLSSAVPNKTSIYEVNGRPITKHTGFLVFKFMDFNCTIEYYKAPFLVVQSRAPAGASEKVKTTLKLDQIDWSSKHWIDADVLVFNTGHWWNNEKTIKWGCYFQEGEEVKMEMSVESAYQQSIETVVDWIGSQVDMSKTHVFFRTYAPVHFRGGDWKTGGTCHLETLPELGSLPVSSLTDPHFKIVIDVLSERSNKSQVMKLDMLNVTILTSRRKDGHSSLYYLGPKTGPAPLNRQDCSHWCLPGVPDSWNELLYALFLKRESIRTRNSTNSSQAQGISGSSMPFLTQKQLTHATNHPNLRKNTPKTSLKPKKEKRKKKEKKKAREEESTLKLKTYGKPYSSQALKFPIKFATIEWIFL